MKFGSGVNEFEIIRTPRFGARHATKGPTGVYAYCAGNPGLCKFCAEHGVPLDAPDPFDAALARTVANYGKRWAESNRHEHPKEGEVWDAKGLHIVALADDNPADRTVLVSFGDDPTAMMAISVLVAAHNKMIGKAD
jgi:hypothetical protein